jgi:hypothetical protein
VEGIEFGQSFPQHRLEAIGKKMHGVENGETVHGPLVE